MAAQSIELRGCTDGPLPLLPLPITSRVLGSSGFESAVLSGGVRALSEGTAWGREAASPSRGTEGLR